MKITVIMPCYNREYDLRRVLEAYDQQDTGIPFELIAVDDASTDDTPLCLVFARSPFSPAFVSIHP